MLSFMREAAVAVRWIAVAFLVLALGCFAWMLTWGKDFPDAKTGMIFLAVMCGIVALFFGVLDALLGRFRPVPLVALAPGETESEFRRLQDKAERAADWVMKSIVSITVVALLVAAMFMPATVSHLIRLVF